MRTYVRTKEVDGVDTVVEVISTEGDIHDLYHPDFVASLVEVTELSPQPAVWWTYTGGEFFSPAAV